VPNESARRPTEMDWSREHLTNLGSKIRRERQRQHLTLRDIADKVGFTPSHISQIERGGANPSLGSLYGIAGVLGVPMEHFFSAEGTDACLPAEASAAQADEGAKNGAKLSTILTERLAELFGPDKGHEGGRPCETDPVVRATDRKVIRVVGGITWHRLTPPHDHTIEFVQIDYSPGASGGDMAYTHRGREYGLVLKGELQVELGFEESVLRAGDSISFDSSIPHRFRNVGEEPVTGIWVIVDRY
jgi:transcriptional regulator with XRE-family HTH domain/quercetin dioxygenase-like cupin family protein